MQDLKLLKPHGVQIAEISLSLEFNQSFIDYLYFPGKRLDLNLSLIHELNLRRLFSTL